MTEEEIRARLTLDAEDYVREMEKAEAEERKRQMDAVKDMVDMSRARFGKEER